MTNLRALRVRLLSPWSYAAFGGTLLAVALVGWAETDPDYWWHIADGRWIVNHLSLPAHAPWLFGISASHPWILAEYGSEVWMFLVGQSGVILITALMLAATCAISAWRVRILGSRSPIAALLAPVVVVLLGWAELAPRDQMVTTLGVALVALFLELQLHSRRVYFWLMPITFLLWANLHPGFIAGLGLWAVALLVWSWQRHQSGNSSVNLRRNFLWFAISCLVTLINPYSIKLWSYAVFTVSGGGASYIQEWQSPNFHWPTFWPLLLLILLLPLAWNRLSLLAKLWIVIAIVASLVSGRNVELLGAIAAAPIVNAFTITLPHPNKGKGSLYALVAILSVILVTAQLSEGIEAKVTNTDQPVTLVTQLRTSFPHGLHIFPTYDSAGYILDHLPQDRVWIFGDNALTGNHPLALYSTITDLGAKWRFELRQTHANLVITSKGEPLTAALSLMPSCQLLFKDHSWYAFSAKSNSCPIAPITNLTKYADRS